MGLWRVLALFLGIACCGCGSTVTSISPHAQETSGPTHKTASTSEEPPPTTESSEPVTDPTDEVSRFIQEIRPAIEARSLRFMDYYSTRCQQVEGIRTEIDIPEDIDGFYSEMLADVHFLASDPEFTVVDSTPDTITIQLPAFLEGYENLLTFKRSGDSLRIDYCEYYPLRYNRSFFLADGTTPVVAPAPGDLPTPLQRAEEMLDSWRAGKSAQYPWLSTRCRLAAQERFGDFWEASSSSQPTEEMPKEAAEELSTSKELEATLFEKHDMSLAWALLKFDIATAEAVPSTNDSVVIRITIADRTIDITTRWIEEFGNLYDDAYCATETFG